MQNTITIPTFTLEQVRQIFREELNEHEINKLKISKKVLTRNQSRLEIGIGYGELDKLLKLGLIKNATDGIKITEYSICEYVRLFGKGMNKEKKIEINKYLGNE